MTVTNQYLDMMTGWLLTFSSFVFVPISFVMFILPFVSKKSSLKCVLPSNDFIFIYLFRSIDFLFFARSPFLSVSWVYRYVASPCFSFDF